MTKLYIWTLPTRAFHLLLILYLLVILITSEFEPLLNIHAAFGYGVGVLLIFRVVWGYMKIPYSNFNDFLFSPLKLAKYMLTIFSKTHKFTGHNPASSWAAIMILIFGALCVATGIILYGVQEGIGPLYFLNSSSHDTMDFFEELHEASTAMFLLVIGAHISGTLLDRWLNGADVISAMVTGYKDGKGKEVSLSVYQRVFATAILIFALMVPIYAMLVPNNLLTMQSHKVINFSIEHPLFAKECASCHTLYPPFLLPKESWAKIMNELEDHFGDDASLQEDDRLYIKEYLVKNSSQFSTKEAAFKIDNSIDENATIIAISQTDYWKKRHRVIDEEVFKQKGVERPSNCKACHMQIEKGILSDSSIKIPIT